MPKKFILIDAHSIIFRSYFAFIKNPLKNSKGENTSGIFGFLNTLEKIKKRLSSEYICLAFDAPGKTFRDEIFEEYKATRAPAPADMPFQVSKVKEISRYLGISSFEAEGYEADDVLATFATKLKSSGDVYIVSSDKDLFQLVRDNTYIYDAYRDEIYDRDKVIEKFGVPPEKIAEFLALTGDTIDNVPGVPGIGPKRAVEIVNSYASFEEAIEKDKRLIPYKDKVLFSKSLVVLECNVPIDIKANDLMVTNPDFDKLMPILLDLEFHSYIKEFAKKYRQEIEVENLKDISEITLGDVVSISIGDYDKLYFCNDAHVVYSTPLKAAGRLLIDKGIVKVGTHFKDVAKKINITPPVFDITIVSWLLDPNRKSHRLEDIVLQNLHIYSEITAASVADVAFQLYPILYKKLKSQGEWELYQAIEEPLIFVLSHMEQRGIKIDLTYFEHLGNEIKKEIGEVEKKIYKRAGQQFNINSPKQLSHILFEKLKLKPLKRGKVHYSTNVEVLQQLSRSHRLPSEILKYREFSKIQSTYIQPLMLFARDGRIHTTFHQTGTATGRLSSSNPNMQNIPIRSELGRRLRKGFIAEHGYKLISADYSQVELRLLAHMTNDKNLIQAFKQGKDIHRHTASLVFNVTEDNVDEHQRRMAKVVNYGLIYGMSDYGLAQGLDIPQEEAVEFIQDYYTLYADVEQWRNQAISLAEERGYTETMFGRRRPLPDLHSKNYALREFSKRAAINTPIQGTAADLIKLAMIHVEKKLVEEKFKSGLQLSIHDELLFEIEDERIDEAREIIKECMEKVITLNVPLEVSIGIGINWGEAH